MGLPQWLTATCRQWSTSRGLTSQRSSCPQYPSSSSHHRQSRRPPSCPRHPTCRRQYQRRTHRHRPRHCPTDRSANRRPRVTRTRRHHRWSHRPSSRSSPDHSPPANRPARSGTDRWHRPHPPEYMPARAWQATGPPRVDVSRRQATARGHMPQQTSAEAPSSVRGLRRLRLYRWRSDSGGRFGRVRRFVRKGARGRSHR